ncbi:MAG: isoprenylcysteine carboxylmethyltransferase family protein [Phycisphaerales bacterium]|jgi:protein-S-isoprenylcysteine O-methyltransferase
MIKIITGTLLVITGFMLRLVAIYTLKNNFRMDLRPPKNVVKNGIYQYVRHPSYTGSIMMMAGLALIEPALGVAYLAFAFFLQRVINEENVIKYKHKDYIEYSNRTGCFLPRLRRRKKCNIRE